MTARGKDYYYFQAGRGTKCPGPRVPIEHEPHSPEFWAAIRQAQGLSNVRADETVNAVIDQYLAFCKETVVRMTYYHYERSLGLARTAWGSLPAAGVRPSHVQALMDGMRSKPAKANHFLSTIKAMSSWARARDLIPQSMVEGVKPIPVNGGHKPWTDEQITAALKALKGIVRIGFLLYLYTGQRGSDVVRLGWTDIDEGGFRLVQQKTKREVWCPIVEELAAEMKAWEKAPGPFVKRDGRYPMSRKLFWKYFDEAKEQIPELEGTTLHGLRCTAVIRLRRAGLEVGQIGDIVGMSLPTIQRYCRFADRKKSGQAALISLNRNGPRTVTVKHKEKL